MPSLTKAETNEKAMGFNRPDEKPENLNVIRWREKYERAAGKIKINKYDELMKRYLGSPRTNRSRNSDSNDPTKMSDNVQHISMQLIESQVDPTQPEVLVESRLPGSDFMAKIAKKKIDEDMLYNDIENLNDSLERSTPVYGLSIVQTVWDVNNVSHSHDGRIKLLEIDPQNFIPQPGVWNIQEMEYFFIRSTVTKPWLMRTFGVDFSGRYSHDREANKMYDESDPVRQKNPTADAYDEDFNMGTIDIITVWYKDEEGDIGRFIFTGWDLIDDQPKFFYRRKRKCKDCKATFSQISTKCPKCNSDSTGTKIMKEEKLDRNIELQPIYFESTVKELQRTNGEVNLVDRVVKSGYDRNFGFGLKIPYYVSKLYPFAIRINTPEPFKFGGQSDIDVIGDQDETLKKTHHKLYQKIAGSGAVIVTSENIDPETITTDTYSILQMKDNTVASDEIKVENLQADITAEMAYIEQQEKIAKETMGITPSFEGQPDPSSRSAAAKRLQIQQTKGRLASKAANKFKFFRDLFKIIFEFNLMFNDEDPFISDEDRKANGNNLFSRYEFLLKDENGNWYYNDDIVFKASVQSSLPTDKDYIYQQAIQLLNIQALTPEAFWKLMVRVGFPMAEEMLEEIKQPEEGNQQAFQLMKALQNILSDPNNQGVFQQLMEADDAQLAMFIQEILGQQAPQTGQIRTPTA
jgi:hypothetical protein